VGGGGGGGKSPTEAVGRGHRVNKSYLLA